MTPLTIEGLRAGSHEVVIAGEGGSVRRTVSIAADRTAELSETLYSGWLHVSSPIELEITDGMREVLLDEQNQALLPPGRHELQFSNHALGYREVRQIEVTPGETTEALIDPAPSALNVVATLPAEVLLDGNAVGSTPLTGHPVSLGTHDVVVRTESAGERRFTVTVTVDPVQLDVDFSSP